MAGLLLGSSFTVETVSLSERGWVGAFNLSPFRSLVRRMKERREICNNTRPLLLLLLRVNKRTKEEETKDYFCFHNSFFRLKQWFVCLLSLRFSSLVILYLSVVLLSTMTTVFWEWWRFFLGGYYFR